MWKEWCRVCDFGTVSGVVEYVYVPCDRSTLPASFKRMLKSSEVTRE